MLAHLVQDLEFSSQLKHTYTYTHTKRTEEACRAVTGDFREGHRHLGTGESSLLFISTMSFGTLGYGSSWMLEAQLIEPH